MINTQYINAVIKSNGGSIELTNGEEIPATPEKINDLLDHIKLLKR